MDFFRSLTSGSTIVFNHGVRRSPPEAVMRALRQEVGFSCPVPGCGFPTLSFHHFDPPWRVEHHHRPEGMIALCVGHHRTADGGAFTVEQLRDMKAKGAARAEAVRGRFDWMRRDLLVRAAGTFFYRCRTIVAFGPNESVWLGHDEQGYQPLNFRMPSASGEPRAEVVDNAWLIPPEAAADVVCPTTGRKLEVTYTNGDRLKIEFFDVDSFEELHDRYGGRVQDAMRDVVAFPITGVEVWQTAVDADSEVGPDGFRAGSNRIIGGGFVHHAGGAGVRLPPLTPRRA